MKGDIRVDSKDFFSKRKRRKRKEKKKKEEKFHKKDF
jgi:hypothetical protein